MTIPELVEPVEIPIPAGADPAAAEFFARLRALKIGAEEGWFANLAGELRAGPYVVELPHGVRELTREEVWWWCLGVGDGYSHGDLIVSAAEVPDLLTIDEAAAILNVSRAGVNYQLARRQLFCAYLGGERHLVAAQVRAAVGDTAAADEWRRLRELWPARVGIGDLPGYKAPDGPGNPKIVAASGTRKRIIALTEGSVAGLFRYRYVDPGRDAYGVAVTVGRQTVRRELVGERALYWALGVADRHGRPDVVAYRPGITRQTGQTR